MSRIIELVDQYGTPTNSFDPRGDIYIKWNADTSNSDEQDALSQIIENDSTSYQYLQKSIAVRKGLVFSLGSGATNCNTSDGFDDFSLYPGKYVDESNPTDYDDVNNIKSGFTDDGFISMRGYATTNKLMPYTYTTSGTGTGSGWMKLIGSIGASGTSTESIILPQDNITLLESNDDGIVSVLIKITNSFWDNIFTSEGMSWHTHKNMNNPQGQPLMPGGTANPELDVLEGITGGVGWGNSEYPTLDVLDNDWTIPYDLLEGKRIAFGIRMQIASLANDNLGISNVAGVPEAVFSESAMTTPFTGSSNNMAVLPYLTFGAGEAPPTYDDPEFNLIAFPDSVEFDSTTVNEGESITGTFGFGVGGFIGTVLAKVFDNSDLEEGEIPEVYSELDNFDEVDDVANHGEITINDGNTIEGGGSIFTLGPGDLIEASLSYIANEVGVSGATDDFSLFITLGAIDLSDITDTGMQDHWQDYYDNLTVAERTWKIPSQLITINDIPEDDDGDGDDDDDVVEPPVDDDYNPSEIMVENPVDVIFHLVEQELRYNKNINAVKIIEARDNHSLWKYAFSINKEIDSKKLLQEMAQSTKLIPTFNNDTFSYAHVKTTYTGDEEISEIKASDVIKYNVSRTELDKLYTEVEVQYKYDYGIENHLETTGKKKINTDFYQNAYGVTMNYGEFLDYNPAEDEKNNYYGLDFDKETNILKHEDTSLIFKSDYIRDGGTADLLANHLLLFHSNQHNIIEMTLPLKYYNLEVGDLVEFDEMIMGRKLYGEKYVLDEVNEEGKFVDMPIRCGQYILPLFMVTDITKTLKNVKIKVIQMHHLSSDDLSWKGEDYMTTELPTEEPEEEPLLGDMNGDESLNVLDIVTMVGFVMGGTFVSIGDMNGDGALNVLDVVTLVNVVLGGSLV